MLEHYQWIKHLATGGMGSTFEGVHQDTDTPTVLKTLRIQEGKERDRLRLAFNSEVEAIARLEHPHVARVFDYGHIKADTELAGRPIPSQSPYLIMAKAPGRPLSHEPMPLSTQALKAFLAQLLETLIYLHARGVTHRDLKPDNIIIDWRPEPHLTLIDFGLAQLHQPQQEQTLVAAGTLAYMAPEQMSARLSAPQGPWTDLYAVGCIAFELATGQLPFEGETLHQQAISRQRGASLRPLQEASLPEGFDVWVASLLELEPQHRLRHAKDALNRLNELGSFASTSDSHLIERSSAGDERERAYSLGLDSSVQFDSSWIIDQDEPTTLSFSSEPYEIEQAQVTLPTQWKEDAAQAGHQLLNTGLGLFGLRRLPIFGRQEQQQVLWEALRAALERRAPHHVSLRGYAGEGKTRLATWLMVKAYEAGLPAALWVKHAERTSADEALAEAIWRELQLYGCDPHTQRYRVELHLGALPCSEQERKLLLNLLLPHQAKDAEATPTTDPSLWALYLNLRSRTSPLLLILDDLQFSQYMARVLGQLATLPPSALLIISTLRQDILESNSAVAKLLQSQLELMPHTPLQLGPLPHQAHRALVQHILPVDPEHVDEIVARTQGNPLFSFYLLGDWVERGILSPGERGFTLPAGASLPLPQSIHSICIDRHERLIARSEAPQPTRAALELAATLGHPISEQIWDKICALVALPQGLDLIELMGQLGLIQSTPIGWDFSHGMLRESLLLELTQLGVLKSRHIECLELLTDEPQHAKVHKRRAHHMMQAQLDEKLSSYLLTFGAELEANYVDELYAPLMTRIQSQLKSHPNYEEIVERLELVRFMFLVNQGRYDEVAELHEQLRSKANQMSKPAHEVTLLNDEAWFSLHTLDYERGLESIERALSFDQAHIKRKRCNILRCKGNLLLFSGELDLAIEAFEQALEHEPDPWEISWIYYELAMTYADLERFELAEAYIERAIPHMERIANISGIGSCLMLKSSMFILQGRSAEAMPMLKESIKLFETCQDGALDMAKEYLARALVYEQRFFKALPLCDEFILDQDEDFDIFSCFFEDIRLAAYCGIRDFERADEQLDMLYHVGAKLPEELITTNLVQPMLRFASELCADAGDLDRARRCLELALTLSSAAEPHRQLELTQSALAALKVPSPQ